MVRSLECRQQRWANGWMDRGNILFLLCGLRLSYCSWWGRVSFMIQGPQPLDGWEQDMAIVTSPALVSQRTSNQTCMRRWQGWAGNFSPHSLHSVSLSCLRKKKKKEALRSLRLPDVGRAQGWRDGSLETGVKLMFCLYYTAIPHNNWQRHTLHRFNTESLTEALREAGYTFSKIFIYSRKGFAECKCSLTAPPCFTHLKAAQRSYSFPQLVAKQCCLLLLTVKCQRLSIIHNGSPDFLSHLRSLNQPRFSRKPNHSAGFAAWRTVVTGMWRWGFLIPAPHVGPLLALYTKLMSSQSVTAGWVTSASFSLY